jgi:hypothetical protein
VFVYAELLDAYDETTRSLDGWVVLQSRKISLARLWNTSELSGAKEADETYDSDRMTWWDSADVSKA